MCGLFFIISMSAVFHVVFNAKIQFTCQINKKLGKQQRKYIIHDVMHMANIKLPKDMDYSNLINGSKMVLLKDNQLKVSIVQKKNLTFILSVNSTFNTQKNEHIISVYNLDKNKVNWLVNASDICQNVTFQKATFLHTQLNLSCLQNKNTYNENICNCTCLRNLYLIHCVFNCTYLFKITAENTICKVLYFCLSKILTRAHGFDIFRKSETYSRRHKRSVQCPPRKYGANCNKTCPPGRFIKNFTESVCNGVCHCSLPEKCFVKNGSCQIGGCKKAFRGAACQNCINTRFGKNCLSECYCINDLKCENNGYCVGGCKKGYTGATCSKKATKKSKKTWAAVWYSIGATSAVVIAVMVLLLACKKWRRKRRIIRTYYKTDSGNLRRSSATPARSFTSSKSALNKSMSGSSAKSSHQMNASPSKSKIKQSSSFHGSSHRSRSRERRATYSRDSHSQSTSRRSPRRSARRSPRRRGRSNSRDVYQTESEMTYDETLATSVYDTYGTSYEGYSVLKDDPTPIKRFPNPKPQSNNKTGQTKKEEQSNSKAQARGVTTSSKKDYPKLPSKSEDSKGTENQYPKSIPKDARASTHKASANDKHHKKQKESKTKQHESKHKQGDSKSKQPETSQKQTESKPKQTDSESKQKSSASKAESTKYDKEPKYETELKLKSSLKSPSQFDARKNQSGTSIKRNISFAKSIARIKLFKK